MKKVFLALLTAIMVIVSGCRFEVQEISGPRGAFVGNMIELEISITPLLSIVEGNKPVLVLYFPESWDFWGGYVFVENDYDYISLETNKLYGLCGEKYPYVMGYQCITLSGQYDKEIDKIEPIKVYLNLKVLRNSTYYDDSNKTGMVKLITGYYDDSYKWNHLEPPELDPSIVDAETIRLYEDATFTHKIGIFDNYAENLTSDSDNDGVPDVWDKCFTVASNGETTVDKNGCALSKCENGEQPDGTWAVIFPDPTTVSDNSFWIDLADSLDTINEWEMSRQAAD